MTDNEIIKALAHCTQHNCYECPRCYETPDDADICKTHLMRNALDLINRQKADKEALIAGQETLQKALAEKNAEIERLQSSIQTHLKIIHDLRSHLKDAHSVAIKEFKQAVGEEISKIPQHHFSFLTVKEAIEKTRKKLAGDAE